MPRKRTIARPNNTVMTTSQTNASAGEAPRPRYSTRPRRGIAAQPPVYTEPDSSDDEDHQPVPTKRKAKSPAQPGKDIPSEAPPAPRNNARHKQVQLSEHSQDAVSDGDDIEGVSREDHYPRYKDDLPSAFNGAVDPSLCFFSRMPNEVIDNILSYLVLDHDPDCGVKMKAGAYTPVPHVLLSMAAMSRLFYQITEAFARRYLWTWAGLDPQAVMKLESWWVNVHAQEKKECNRRRSDRIAKMPQVAKEIYRTELCNELHLHCAVCLDLVARFGRLANQVFLCETCEQSVFGETMNLTDALKEFDLRDYMLIKSRKPGPKAKLLDLPIIPYGTEYKRFAFPLFYRVCVYYFRRSDVEMLAKMVHGDVNKHMEQKAAERKVRRQRARTKRVRSFKIEYHRGEFETSTDAIAELHSNRLEELLALDPYEEEHEGNRFGCGDNFCYHDIGLCNSCGDVPGCSHESCRHCESIQRNRRHERILDHIGNLLV